MEITSPLNLAPAPRRGPPRRESCGRALPVHYVVAFIPYNWLLSTTYVPELVI
jgi:hypothetical protein